MSTWAQLWQSALLGEPINIFTGHRETILRDKLEDKRREAVQDFSKDGGHFVRLSGIRSNRHRSLLGDHLLPELKREFEKLEKYYADFLDADAHKLHQKILELEHVLRVEWKELFSDIAITERYEQGVLDDKIDDSTFHRKTSLRVLKDCTNSILAFGQALADYWKIKDVQFSGINSQTLQSELSRFDDLTALGRAAFDYIAKTDREDQLPWDVDYAQKTSKEYIFEEILSDSSYTIRLPHTISYLVNYDLQWEDIRGRILNDLAYSLSPNEVAKHLLDANAPNQVLLITQHISLDNQKDAQILRKDRERKIEILEKELLQLGGKIEGFLDHRALGRWGLADKLLSDEIDILGQIKEDETRVKEEKSYALVQKINTLDMEIAKVRSQIPTAVYQLIVQGLNKTREALLQDGLFTEIEGYLEELQYRLDRNSWPEKKLRQVTDNLIKVTTEATIPGGFATPLLQILEYLENEQVEELGLSKNSVTISEMKTRADLLINWFLAKDIKTVKSEEIHRGEIVSIQQLFRYFAQMVKMKRYQSIAGEPIENEYPLVYEYWKLQFPKTNALDSSCIFMALPGDPPSPKDIKYLRGFLDNKEFLEYSFVFLFVLGSTDKITNRLKSAYAKKGLLIIDDQSLRQMLLAEAQNLTPLGRLRPMMLNAIQANTDIFTVNQSVNARTAIFVGRGNLIDRIVASGDNYALYGGRRIGKSSVLYAVAQRLKRRIDKVVLFDLQGEAHFNDNYVSQKLFQELWPEQLLEEDSDLKSSLNQYLEENPQAKIVILIDEIDRYITVNNERHTLIETLRSTSDRFGDRFRVIIAGFVDLYDCLKGRGPYTPTNDPWIRTFNGICIENLNPISAEKIVQEGFLSILGWSFENISLPRQIYMHTGGHPAFVQKFCLKLLERVRKRGDQIVKLMDIEAVWVSEHPQDSFIAYVQKTLGMNLKMHPLSRYLVPWLASGSSAAQGFTWDGYPRKAGHYDTLT